MHVRVNSTYIYEPVPLDSLLSPPMGAVEGFLKPGDLVKVVNKYGCPPANTMGHAYIEKNGRFAGLVSCNSLVRP